MRGEWAGNRQIRSFLGFVSSNEVLSHIWTHPCLQAYCFAMTEESDCMHISGLDIGGRCSLLAMMESALFLLNSFSTCASTVSALNMVWKSWLDLFRHQYGTVK